MKTFDELWNSLNFLIKREQEQTEYILNTSKSSLPRERKTELIQSAFSVFERIQKQKAQVIQRNYKELIQ